MGKDVIIIGAGMGGLASGIYGQSSGYNTRIFEMHTVPGGQCCSWKRKGYTFDGCIHHLFGCSDFSGMCRLWKEMGAMPREQVYTKECTAVVSPEGRLFRDYWDLEALQRHIKELSPADTGVAGDYVKGIRAFARTEMWGGMVLGNILDKASTLLKMIPALRWTRPTMEDYAGRFKDPFLKKAFPLLEYSITFVPFMIHLIKHAHGLKGDIAWPVGASLGFSRSIEERYLQLGGEIDYRSKVVKILTEDDRAVGVRLEDGTEHRADLVISNADGRKTILEMLGGRYIDDRVKSWCEPPEEEMPWAVHVFLGVDRDLSEEPSALVMLLDEPVRIANHTCDSIEMQTYGFDRTMAPEGKGVIKVELVSGHSYWRELYRDKERYYDEKQRIADQVIELLDAGYFKGVKEQVEVVDVPTLVTWERFMGGSYGFNTMPSKEMNVMGSLFGKGVCTLPGLSDFYMVGQWATSAGALFMNAFSGRQTVEAVCREDGVRFTVP